MIRRAGQRVLFLGIALMCSVACTRTDVRGEPAPKSAEDPSLSYQALYRAGRFEEAARALQHSVGDCSRPLTGLETGYAHLIYKATFDGNLVSWAYRCADDDLRRRLDENRVRGAFTFDVLDGASRIPSVYLMPPQVGFSRAWMMTHVNGRRNYAMIDTGAHSPLFIPKLGSLGARDLTTSPDAFGAMAGTVDIELPVGVFRNVLVHEREYDPVASIDNNLVIGLPVIVKLGFLELAIEDNLAWTDRARGEVEQEGAHEVDLYFGEKNGYLYADLEVNDRILPVMIDTGMNMDIVLPESDVCRDGSSEESREYSSWVGGQGTSSVERCSAEVSIGGEKIALEARVIVYRDDEVGKSPLRSVTEEGSAVLGFGFFAKFGRAVFDFRSMKLRLYDKGKGVVEMKDR